MRLDETADALARFHPRLACSDAERRAAVWLRDELRDGGRASELEPHWIRPRWAWSLALHCMLAAAASVLAVDQPVAATALAGLTLVSLVVESLGLGTLLGLVAPRRATQNVVAPALAVAGEPTPALRLVVCARYDEPRSADGRRALLTRTAALTTLPILAAAVARAAGIEDRWLSFAQVAPTFALLFVLALCVDSALAPVRASSLGNSSAVAVALGLAKALRTSPPRNLAVELALCGAGPLGMRGYLHKRRSWPRDRVAVLEISQCGSGRPVWAVRDGALLQLRLHRRMAELCSGIAAANPALGASVARGSQQSPALAARVAGWSAVRIGAGSTSAGASPGEGANSIDGANNINEEGGGKASAASMASMLAFALAFVQALDRDVEREAPSSREES